MKHRFVALQNVFKIPTKERLYSRARHTPKHHRCLQKTSPPRRLPSYLEKTTNSNASTNRISYPNSHPSFSQENLPQAYPHKLLPPNPALAPNIKLLNHSRQFLLLQPLPQLPRHPPQIPQFNPALPIRIEQFKRSQDFFTGIARIDALCRDGEEVRMRQEKARWSREGGLCG